MTAGPGHLATVAPTVQPCGRTEFVRMLAARGVRRGAEIGVRQGAFSLELCRIIPGLDLLCVDPWHCYPTNPKQPSQDRQDENYRVATDRLRPYGATLIRDTSTDAVRTVPALSLDFVYVDGNHAYQWIRQDLDAWSLRVRHGGIVAGDDYDAPGVHRAVHEFVEAHGITDWYVLDERRRRNRKGERFRSFWWVQP